MSAVASGMCTGVVRRFLTLSFDAFCVARSGEVRYPFLPLMLVSLSSAVGNIWGFFVLLRSYTVKAQRVAQYAHS